VSKLRWGIIGTGLIAKEFADGINASTTGELSAVASRTRASAETFGDAYRVPHRFDSYQSMLDSSLVDAVYICTPHPMHAEWSIKAAEAGKHILVEKPIGMNWFETMAMIDAARVNDVFLMEAFMYRCHPQMRKLAEIIRAGAIGAVQMIRASFSYAAGFDPANRQYNNDLGGGGILDVGCYPVSIARLIAGAAQGKSFAEPIDVKGVGHLGPTGVDHYAAAVLRFAGDLIAQVCTGIGLNTHNDNIVEIFGSDGKITLPDPWIPSRWDRSPAKIILKRHKEKSPETILVPCADDLYTCEADEVARNISARQAPAMSWDDSLGNMRVLDRWRAELGLVYESEKPARATNLTTAGRPIQFNRTNEMAYGTVKGIDKKISRLVFGCDSNHTWPDTAVMLDDFFERGGNTFDTSHGYGNPNGACEINLGSWVKQRGVCDQVVIIEKGANYHNGNPRGLSIELLAGLERLQMDHVDIYMIHRDNEQVPIGEWVDVLNEHLSSGRMSVFGLSNFTILRLQAFAEYAKKNGKQNFSVVSNQFSLAELLAPIWDVFLVSSGDRASRQWFIDTQTPLFPWSSQARGFFLPAATPENRSNAEWVRCWYNSQNFARKSRADELAKKYQVETINIALAWVLAQSFPTFPLVGPKQLSETRSTLRALSIKLTPDEVDWLSDG